MAEASTWPWWWSTDEERYHGPCNSRADAIADAWANDARGSIHIMQAVHGELRCAIYSADDIAEAFAEANEDLGDEDGDGVGSEIPNATWDKIAERFTRIIREAVREHGVSAFMFGETACGERVDLSIPAIAALPAAARAIIADLAEGWSTQFGLAEHYVQERMAELTDELAPAPSTPAEKGEV